MKKRCVVGGYVKVNLTALLSFVTINYSSGGGSRDGGGFTAASIAVAERSFRDEKLGATAVDSARVSFIGGKRSRCGIMIRSRTSSVVIGTTGSLVCCALGTAKTRVPLVERDGIAACTDDSGCVMFNYGDVRRRTGVTTLSASINSSKCGVIRGSGDLFMRTR